MASGEEQQPQWIVTNRADGTNVNGWHWVEKDAMAWLKKEFLARTAGMELTPRLKLDAKGVEVSGEATVNYRRGKTIFLYELSANAKWEYRESADFCVEGEYSISYLGEDNEDEVDDWNVHPKTKTVGKNADEKKIVQNAANEARAAAAKAFRKAVAAVLEAMKQHYREGNTASHTTSSGSIAPPVPEVAPAKPVEKKSAPVVAPVRSDFKGATLKFDEKFTCPAKEIYNAYLDTQKMSMVTGGATIEKTIGGKFVMFSGAVSGINEELITDTKIVQKWRFSSWEPERYSRVEMTFENKNGGCVVHITQRGVPEADKDRTEHGWRENIWPRMRQMFGYGVAIPL